MPVLRAETATLSLLLMSIPVFSSAQSAAPASSTGRPGAAEALPTVEIVGRRQAGAYEADDAQGLKSSLPLRETPQSVRVMTRQTIDDLGAIRLDDLLDYVGGVSRQNNFGGLWDNIAIRGLAGNENTGMSTLLNGFSANRGFNAPRDTANLERIEFLKGPMAALYGTSEPGGTVNLVSKQPQWAPGHALEAYGGSHDFYRLALDSTGPLGESLAYRLNIAREQRASFRDFVRTERTLFAPAFTWRLSAQTRLDYQGEWLNHSSPLDRGVVAVNNRLGVVPRNRFLGEPADGPVEVDNQTHQLILSHRWNDRWSMRAGLSHKRGTLEGFSTEATALQADQQTLRRQRRFRDYGSNDLAGQFEVSGKVTTGALAHELLLGVEAYRFVFDQRMLRINPSNASPYAIDIFNPVYGQAQPIPLPNTDTHERQNNLAFYLQDSIRLGSAWRIVLGARADQFRQSLDNRRNGTQTRQDDTAVSPRAGLAYLLSPEVSIFLNTGQSFRPNAGVSVASAAFEPEKGRSLELGAKWESRDRRMGASVALFDIRKRNVLTADPVNAGFSITAGKVRSRGLEMDVAGQLTRQWRVNASLSLLDASVLEDNLLETGGRLLNVPRVNGSLLAVYEDRLADGSRYGVGGGVTHVGKRLGEARTQAQADAGATAFDLPAYTTAKLLAYWRVNRSLRLSLDVDNVFDRSHFTSSFSRVWVTPGFARTVTLGVQARF